MVTDSLGTARELKILVSFRLMWFLAQAAAIGGPIAFRARCETILLTRETGDRAKTLFAQKKEPISVSSADVIKMRRIDQCIASRSADDEVLAHSGLDKSTIADRLLA
jgi:hypothetical protein